MSSLASISAFGKGVFCTLLNHFSSKSRGVISSLLVSPITPMIKTLHSRDLTLRGLIVQCSLQSVDDPHFFREWQDDLPAVSNSKRFFLDKLQQDYFNLIHNPSSYDQAVGVKIIIPLLHIAKLFNSSFHIHPEESIAISAEDEGILIRGQLDILILKEQLWLMVVKSEGISFSIEAGLEQLLSYMLTNSHIERPSFGLITNGESFMFLKLVREPTPQYANSRIFHIRNPGNELYEVFRILKKLGQIPLI